MAGGGRVEGAGDRRAAVQCLCVMGGPGGASVCHGNGGWGREGRRLACRVSAPSDSDPAGKQRDLEEK